ncbi:anti-anti-sigma factor [Mycobacterium frederiksbergense]|uniref:Anti-anti-sigma factor n=1 Tax=Mycolicibacterium frederiksbergense TaxID=117567 RepID=A0ABT6L3D2_9MYCO|nr:STAS domain-containing protein [Mycolicibacterium frederiksbergense]MDH6196825.1 anti-anti-sigma factor [Mycolicibacterium frederiksbergense]
MTVFSTTASSTTAASTNAPIEWTDDSPAMFATRWLPPSTAVISTRGDVDAANAADFADYALQHTAEAERVVIDLTGVDFLGTAGFSALEVIAARWSVGGVDWIMVPSKAVRRLLRICDPDSELRTSYSMVAALSTLNGKTPLLHLVTKSR